jgi:4-hydroxy-3-methylbut-2-enyl diphosphate reductase
MIKLIEPLGFCYGVRNSLSKVYRLRKEHPQTPIFLLHPLVHNPATTEKLAKDTGAKLYDPSADPKTYKDSYIVLPAHGSTSRERLLVHYLMAEPLDCTCPFLTASKAMMKKDLKAGRKVYFLGKEGHAETLAVLDLSKDIVFLPASQAASFDFSAWKEGDMISVYPQSTLGYSLYADFGARAQAAFQGDLRLNPLCHECLARWMKAAALKIRNLDSFVIVGDETSSNAAEYQKVIQDAFPTHAVFLVSDEKKLAEVLPQLDFRGSVYLASSTSASAEQVRKLYKILRRFNLKRRLQLLFHGQLW